MQSLNDTQRCLPHYHFSNPNTPLIEFHWITNIKSGFLRLILSSSILTLQIFTECQYPHFDEDQHLSDSP